tara:strand:- start:92 stop:547 length:456 start_codon:yes stop_codon:yes gene_type:complete
MLTILLTIFTVQADELNRKYHWETIPTIEICPESNVSLDNVYTSLEYWEKEVGFKYGPVKKVKKCVKGKLNTIQITDGKGVNTNRHLALTSVYSYHYSDDIHTKYVDYAIVRIPDIPKYDYMTKEIITHEIGHAVGFGHSETGVMHESAGY